MIHRLNRFGEVPVDRVSAKLERQRHLAMVDGQRSLKQGELADLLVLRNAAKTQVDLLPIQ
jgi:hypothetical protein